MTDPQQVTGRSVPLAHLWRALAPYLGRRRHLAFLAGLALIAGAAQAAFLVLIGYVAVAIATGEPQSLGPMNEIDVPNLLAVAGALAVLVVVLQLSEAALSARMSAEALARSRKRLLRLFFASSWEIRSQERRGHLQELLSTHADRVALAVMGFSSFVVAAFDLAALVVAALVVNPAAALAIGVVGSALGAASRPVMRHMRSQVREGATANVLFATSVAEAVGLAQEVTVFGVSEPFGRRIADRADTVTRPLRRGRFLQRAIPDGFRNSALILVVIGLGIVYSLPSPEVASLSAVVLLLMRSVSYGRDLQMAMVKFNEVLPYVEELARHEDRYRLEALPTGGSPVDSVGRLRLEGVSYRYPGDSTPAVAGITLEIHKGEAIGVIGPSGSGKSTLFQLLLRLRQPYEGALLVDDRPAVEIELSSWFEHVALVPQDPALIEGTVSENIRFFRDRIPEERIAEAARQAQIHNEIEAMPEGYATLLGPSRALSGGQRQRLCLARALAAEPQVLFLDEPTSALDLPSESKIHEALERLKGSVTLIVIAHRLSTLGMCDRILVLRNGSVDAFGTPSQLLEGNEFYQRAVKLSRLE